MSVPLNVAINPEKPADIDAAGCVLLGEAKFYARFGFRNIPEVMLDDVPQEFFLALPFGGLIPYGKVQYHEGFAATSY